MKISINEVGQLAKALEPVLRTLTVRAMQAQAEGEGESDGTGDRNAIRGALDGIITAVEQFGARIDAIEARLDAKQTRKARGPGRPRNSKSEAARVAVQSNGSAATAQ